MKTQSRSPKNHNPQAFALVVTLSLMVLLTIVAVSLLSLSAISLRGTSQAQAQAEAQSNARLALMIAIGELQKQMGPDQRISANSNIVSPETVPNPNWTGVWDSWVAGAQSSAPVNPNYPSAFNSAHQTIGSQADPRMRPSYQQKDRHFRSWLLSLDPSDVTNAFAPMGSVLQGKNMPQSGDSAVTLVGEGSLGTSSDSKDYVSASLLALKDTAGTATAGRYAWWVGDESQKARISDDSYLTTPPANMAEKIFSVDCNRNTKLATCTCATQYASLGAA
jgi:Flp pilus assembly protein TadG